MKVGYLSPSGWGNLGDEAIQAATIRMLRAAFPGVEIRAFTLAPDGTAAHQGIEAEPITGMSIRHNRVRPPQIPRALRGFDALTARVTRPWILRRALERVGATARIVVLEGRSLRRSRAWLRSADLLLVAGGGQLDDLWGGAWGHPYALARWAFLAKRARVPFAILSVGYGQAGSSLSRRFLAYALRNARYRSVRDEGSRRLVAGLGPELSPRVAPDLAFGLRKAEGEPPKDGPRCVGMAPMGFRGPSWPEPDDRAYQALLGLYASLAESRAHRGDRIHLFTTQPSDERAVDDVLARLSPQARAACVRERVASVDQLLALYARLHAVIGTRLHAVILAMVAERPVLALAYERKVRTVMEDVGLDAWCFDLARPDPAAIDAALEDLLDRAAAVRTRLAERVEGWRRELHAQADALAGLVGRRG